MFFLLFHWFLFNIKDVSYGLTRVLSDRDDFTYHVIIYCKGSQTSWCNGAHEKADYLLRNHAISF